MTTLARKHWPSVQFKEIVAHSAFGPRFGGELYSESGNVATLRTTDLGASGEISYDTMPLAQIDESRFADHFLRVGDLVISRSGRIGTTAIFRGFSLPVLPGAFLIRFRLVDSANPDFFCYFFNSPNGQALLHSVARGAAQQNINISNVEQLKVPFPSQRDQAEIVSILSAYDSLIENNRRRIALLEEAARMLYREWFIHFRFPGHEHVKFIDGMPEGWERWKLADVAEDISYGYTESASHDVEGPRFLRITDIVDGPIKWSDVPRCPITEEKLARFILAPNEIVVARTGATTGWARRIGRLPEPAVFASYLVRFRFGQRYRPEIAATFMQSEAYKAFVKGNLGGAAQPNASAKVLGNAPCIIASDSIQTYFVENVTPMFEQIDVLMEQNQKLSLARDLLLPRMMNGEIAV